MAEKRKKSNQEEDEIFDQYYDLSSVASATSYTGLTQTPPLSEEEAESYSEIWSYPKPESTPQLENKKKE